MPTARGFPTGGWRSASAAYRPTFGGAVASARSLPVSPLIGSPRLPPVGPLAPIAGAALTAYGIWKAGEVAWDFYSWYSSGGTAWLPPAYALYDPFAGWSVACNVGGTVDLWTYGPGIDCGLVVFQAPGTYPGGNDTSQLFGWDEGTFIFGSTDYSCRVKYTRGDGVVAPLPATGVQPGQSSVLPMTELNAVRPWNDRAPAPLLEAIAMTEALTVRGYDAPVRDTVGAELLRSDAYSENPGRTFVWEVSATGVRPVQGPIAIPGVNAPALPGVRPIPGQIVEVVKGGATVVQPVATAAQPLFPARPAPGVKERKAKMSIAGQASLIPGGLAGLRFFNLATETCDAVDALWKAIPFKEKLRHGWVKRLPKGAKFRPNDGKPRPDIQLADNRKTSYAFDTDRWKPGEGQTQKFHERKFSQPGCVRKARIIASGGWHFIDTEKAFWNLVEEQFQDTVIGTLANKATRAYGKAQRRIGAKGASPVLGPAL